MPRITTSKKQQPSPGDWRQAILEQLRSGKVLPIVSNRVHNDLLLGGHEALARAYCEHHAVPAVSAGSIAAAAQYNTIMRELAGAEDLVKREYLDFAKSRLLELTEAADSSGALSGLLEEEDAQFDEHDFSVMAANLGCPRFAGPDSDPLLILAGFDLPIYLTTSFHCFVEQALRAANKKPRTGVCCWHPRIAAPDPFADDWQPTALEPLVFHLYGIDSCPESLVLSEDDYLAFLVNIAGGRHLIPNRLRQALNDSSLLLLGYELADCDFRTLLYSLIKTRSYCLQSVCALQLQPSPEEQAYLNRYMEVVSFKVFWGDFSEYLRQLQAGLRG
jgi:hypothetical protein